MDFHERLMSFISDKGFKIAAFEKEVGFSNGSLRQTLENKRSITSDRLEVIFNKYPELSPTWLFTGRGQMYQEESETIDELKGMIKSLKRIVKTQEDIKDELRSQNAELRAQNDQMQAHMKGLWDEIDKKIAEVLGVVEKRKRKKKQKAG